MLIAVNFFIFVMLAIVGGYISKVRNQKFLDIVYNIEIGLFFSILVLYIVGNTEYNQYAGLILLGLIIAPALLNIVQDIKEFKHYIPMYKLKYNRAIRDYTLILIICIFSPLFAYYLGQIRVGFSGDGFYSWATWATHWATRDSLQEYKFVYAQNLPIIISGFNRMYASSSIFSPGTIAFKLFMIQYLVLSVSRIFYIDKKLTPSLLKYIFVIVAAFIFLIAKTGMFEKIQSGLPDVVIGLVFFGIIFNLKRIVDNPVVVFLFLFGLVNLKITALPYFVVIAIAILYLTYRNNRKIIIVQLLVIIASFSPYIIDHMRDTGDQVLNHTHSSSLAGYSSVSAAVSSSRQGILGRVKSEWDKVPDSNFELSFNDIYTNISRNTPEIISTENILDTSGYGGKIYITPNLFFLNDKFLVFFKEFGSDIAIYLTIVAVILLLFVWPIIGIPLFIAIVVMWKYTHYGFYNLNGSYLLLMLALFYLAVHKVNIKYPFKITTSIFLSFLALIVFFLGVVDWRGKKDDTFLPMINKFVWTKSETLEVLSRSVTDSIDPAYVMLELKKRFPKVLMYMPVPFNRLDGTFVKSSEIDSYDDPLMSDVALYYPRQVGSLMVGNMALQMKSSFYENLPIVKIDNKTISCLGSTHGLIDQKQIEGIPRFFDLGLLCNNNNTSKYGINLSCSKMEFYSGNFRSPINGQNLNTIDMKNGEAYWWSFDKNSENSINLTLSSHIRENYNLVISAINEYEVRLLDSGITFKGINWPSSELIEELSHKLSIKLRTFDVGALPRLIAGLSPKDKGMFVSSCGEYGEGRLCALSGTNIEKSCANEYSK